MQNRFRKSNILAVTSDGKLQVILILSSKDRGIAHSMVQVYRMAPVGEERNVK